MASVASEPEAIAEDYTDAKNKIIAHAKVIFNSMKTIVIYDKLCQKHMPYGGNTLEALCAFATGIDGELELSPKQVTFLALVCSKRMDSVQIITSGPFSLMLKAVLAAVIANSLLGKTINALKSLTDDPYVQERLRFHVRQMVELIERECLKDVPVDEEVEEDILGSILKKSPMARGTPGKARPARPARVPVKVQIEQGIAAGIKTRLEEVAPLLSSAIKSTASATALAVTQSIATFSQAQGTKRMRSFESFQPKMHKVLEDGTICLEDD